MKISKRTVDALKPDPTKRLYVYDDKLDGFGVIVQPSGTRSYIFEYRPGAGGRRAQKRRITIGRHGQPWTPDTARTRAEALQREVKAGGDPATNRTNERRGPDPDATFAAVARRFLEAKGRSKRRRGFNTKTAAGYRSTIESKMVPAWGNRPFETVTLKDVDKLVDSIADTHPAMARLTFASARSLFAWGVDKLLLDVSPLDGIRGPVPARRRQRVLDESEVRLLWKATEGDGLYESATRLLLLTGARREEVSAARWAEIDLPGAVWRIEGTRTKNGEPHEIDLASAALAELAKLEQRQRNVVIRPAAIAPSARTLSEFRRAVEPHWFGRRPLASWSFWKRRLDARIAALAEDEGLQPVARWRIHDLRRTCATGMQRLGFGTEVVERCLNHLSGTRGGLVGTYQTDDLRERRKAAHLGWAEHVEQIVSGKTDAGNVIELNRLGA